MGYRAVPPLLEEETRGCSARMLVFFVPGNWHMGGTELRRGSADLGETLARCPLHQPGLDFPCEPDLGPMTSCDSQGVFPCRSLATRSTLQESREEKDEKAGW